MNIKMRSTIASVALALAVSLASCKIGIGPCPNVTAVPGLFKLDGKVKDGRYHLMGFDQQFKWGWETWIRDNTKKVKDSLNCQSANITKIARGFSLKQNNPLPDFDEINQATFFSSTNVYCEKNDTCNSFFQGKRLVPVYYDEKEPTIILYQCLDLTYALSQLESSTAKLDSKWQGIITAAKKFSDNIHYTMMIVLSQNPDKQSKDAKKRIDTFINSFSDQVANLKLTDKLFNLAVKALGWDGKKVYSTVSDIFKPDQSKSTCKY